MPCNLCCPSHTNNCSFLLKLFCNSSVWYLCFLPTYELLAFINFNIYAWVSHSSPSWGLREGPRDSAVFSCTGDVEKGGQTASVTITTWLKEGSTPCFCSCLRSQFPLVLHMKVWVTFPKWDLIFPVPCSNLFHNSLSLDNKVLAWRM